MSTARDWRRGGYGTRPTAARADLLDEILCSPMPSGARQLAGGALHKLARKHRSRTIACRDRLDRVRRHLGFGGLDDDVRTALEKELKAARRAAKQALCDWLGVEFALDELPRTAPPADLLNFAQRPAPGLRRR